MSKAQLIGILLFCSGLCFGQTDFYATDQIQRIEIEFSQANWRALLDSLKSNNSEARLLAGVAINGQRYDSTGIRFKGNSSYNSVLRDGSMKLPFNIKLDHFNRLNHYQGYQTI